MIDDLVKSQSLSGSESGIYIISIYLEGMGLKEGEKEKRILEEKVELTVTNAA